MNDLALSILSVNIGDNYADLVQNEIKRILDQQDKIRNEMGLLNIETDIKLQMISINSALKCLSTDLTKLETIVQLAGCKSVG